MSAGDWKDMFLAACDGDVELVRFHLARGVDVDFAHPEFQSTALVASILAGREEMAHLLLDHGADPVLRSTLEEQTPVQAAQQAGLAGVVDRLRAMGRSEPRARPPTLADMTQPKAEGPLARSGDHPLASARYVQLTTFRRTGVPVPTPVWFAPSPDDPTVFAAITVDDTGKTKRIAHTRRVELRACDVRGRVKEGTPTYRGSARVVRDTAGVALARRAVVAKYGLPARMSDLVDNVGSRVGLRRAPRAGIIVLVDPEPLAPEDHAGPR